MIYARLLVKVPLCLRSEAWLLLPPLSQLALWQEQNPPLFCPGSRGLLSTVVWALKGAQVPAESSRDGIVFYCDIFPCTPVQDQATKSVNKSLIAQWPVSSPCGKKKRWYDLKNTLFQAAATKQTFGVFPRYSRCWKLSFSNPHLLLGCNRALPRALAVWTLTITYIHLYNPPTTTLASI